MSDALLQSTLPLPVRRGKVRDVYDLGNSLLIVATDRISAYDCVMPNGIPGKGKILTAMSLFWFKLLAPRVKNHLLATEVTEYPKQVRAYADQLEGRSMLVEKANVIPIECVARGYLAGSGWKEYQQSQTVCGVQLPPGLRQCDKLPQPIFTPATKEESGHDINISFAETVARIGDVTATELRDRTLSLYGQAADYAAGRGVIIADTKFEFGTDEQGVVHLMDEALTPDSSRFWDAAQYQVGISPPSYDKQIVRNWLEQSGWNKQAPAPQVPEDVLRRTADKYNEVLEKLTGARIAL